MGTLEIEQPALRLTPLEPRQDTMLSVIERAVMSPDFDVNKLAALLALRERYEAMEAKRAFVESMNAFKLNPPTIIKTKQVSFNNTHYKHATLDGVCDAVINGLSAVGISHRWATKQDDKTITVTCVLTHKMGHSEETALTGPADNSGSKNALQAIGSTVTYLERYTLMAACGLAAGEDDDGHGANSQPQGQQTPVGGHLGDEQYIGMLDGVQNAGDVDELKVLYLAAVAEAEKVNDMKAKNEFIKAKNKRYKEIRDAR